MPKSDTWPGGVAMETLSNMDSAGSCDSVISVNSAFSDDSLEHLSPEERACLMFLEETIESLELEEDSGLSNDELDRGQHETTPQQPSIPTDIETTPQQQSVPNDIETTPQQTPVPSDIKTTPQQSSVPNVIETTPQKSSIPSDIETIPQQLSVPNDIETTPQQLSVPSDTETTPKQSSITHDAQDFQHDETGRDQKSFLSGGVPTPFLLANSLPERASADIAEPETPDEPTEPTSAALSIEHSAQHQAPPHEHADLQTSADADDANAPTTAPTTEQTSPELQTQYADPATDTRTPSPAATSTVSDSDTSVVDRDEGTEKDAQPGGHSSEMDLGLIPPPSDFRDEPTTPQPEPEHQKDQELLDYLGTSHRSSITPTDMENLGRQAVKTPAPVSSPVSLDPPSKPPVEVPVSGNGPSSLPEMPHPSPPLEAVEIKSPPAVAPRPKKLPSNIILKSHKPPGSNGTPAHPVSSSSDRLILDPQRVRMEALRKLGLLKSEERVPGPPILSPNNLSRGSRKSWAALSAPLSPPHVPTSTPSPLPVPAINPPSVPAPSQVPGTVPPLTVEAPLADSSAVRDVKILPAPVAFSDTAEPLPPVRDVSEYTGSDSQVPTVPPASPKNKSATLERSGMGLSGYMTSQKSESTGGGAINAQRCPSEVRNTRARPASLGSRKDFSEAQGGYQESLPAAHPNPHLTGDLQKLPRSHGISVVICPRAKNGEDRRVALKKLGLLRD